MKIEIYKDKKWKEIDGYDFDIFISAVAYMEYPFKFTDCTNKEIEEFIKYLNTESGCLDDDEYYRWCCKADTSNVVYIFEDMCCKELTEALENAKRKVEEYEKYMVNICKEKS